MMQCKNMVAVYGLEFYVTQSFFDIHVTVHR